MRCKRVVRRSAGSGAVANAKRLQKKPQSQLWAHAPMSRLIRELMDDGGNDRSRAGLLTHLHEAAEAYAATLVRDAAVIATACNAKTLRAEHFEAVDAVRGIAPRSRTPRSGEGGKKKKCAVRRTVKKAAQAKPAAKPAKRATKKCVKRKPKK